MLTNYNLVARSTHDVRGFRGAHGVILLLSCIVNYPDCLVYTYCTGHPCDFPSVFANAVPKCIRLVPADACLDMYYM